MNEYGFSKAHLRAWTTLRFAIFLVALGSALGCNASPQTKPQPRAQAGVLDLSHWNFANDGPLALSGEYEFYWRQHLPPEKFSAEEAPRADGFVQVPGVWNDYVLNGKKPDGEGYATYHLRVLLKKPEPLVLKFLDMATAFTVYANGKKIFAAGRPQKTRAATHPRYFPEVVAFTPETNRLDLVLHVSNFHHKKGGAWEPIRLGTHDDLHKARAQALQLDLFLFGCIMTMGLYHLGLFAVRTTERAPLFFGIFCLLIAVRTSVISERGLLQFFPHLDWEVLGKIEYLAYYLAVPVGAFFLHTLYEQDFPKILLRAIQILSGLFSATVLCTPVRIFSHTVAAHHVYTILSCLAGVVVIIMASVRRREGARINLAGFFLLFLAILNDILNYFHIIHTPLALPFGLLAFIFSQAVLLSYHFSKAFRTIDWQRAELEKVIRQYERELIEKRRLEVRYRALYNDNPTMYFTVDAAGKVLSVNQYGREYLGYKAEELIGQPVVNVFYEEDKPRVPQQLEICLQEPQRVHEWELRKVRKDGSVLWVKEFARCVQNPDGTPLLLIVCEDLTARKQAEAELQASRERLRELEKQS